jgi:hypothetical protein
MAGPGPERVGTVRKVEDAEGAEVAESKAVEELVVGAAELAADVVAAVEILETELAAAEVVAEADEDRELDNAYCAGAM